MEKNIYQLIYSLDMAKNTAVRSPTLETVKMVEVSIEKYSGEYSRTKVWNLLPKKVMWQTYLVILDYLKEIKKIAVDKEGKLAYIWNPRLASILRKREEIKV